MARFKDINRPENFDTTPIACPHCRTQLGQRGEFTAKPICRYCRREINLDIAVETYNDIIQQEKSDYQAAMATKSAASDAEPSGPPPHVEVSYGNGTYYPVITGMRRWTGGPHARDYIDIEDEPGDFSPYLDISRTAKLSGDALTVETDAGLVVIPGGARVSGTKQEVLSQMFRELLAN